MKTRPPVVSMEGRLSAGFGWLWLALAGFGWLWLALAGCWAGCGLLAGSATSTAPRLRGPDRRPRV